MSALGSALAEYLAVRRALGYQLRETERQLTKFVTHLDQLGIDTVTVSVAVAWATATPRGGPGAQRLAIVRGFVRYLQALDPAHEIPPTGLLPTRTARSIPHLYSEHDIAGLMAAATELDPPTWAAAVRTMIGLLWATGMRVGEVLRLNVADFDIDASSVTVWHSKFNKSRLVPLASSTTDALCRYREGKRSTAMFVTPKRQRVAYQPFNRAFGALLDQVAIRTTDGRRPRVYDLRHSFAVRTLTGWYRDGLDVQAMLPHLSTYMGHVEPASTYWYLSAAPELMALAAERLDRHTEGSNQ